AAFAHPTEPTRRAKVDLRLRPPPEHEVGCLTLDQGPELPDGRKGAPAPPQPSCRDGRRPDPEGGDLGLEGALGEKHDEWIDACAVEMPKERVEDALRTAGPVRCRRRDEQLHQGATAVASLTRRCCFAPPPTAWRRRSSRRATATSSRCTSCPTRLCRRVTSFRAGRSPETSR